jgi:transposase-like protein
LAKPGPEGESSGGRDDRRSIGTTAAPREAAPERRFSARRKREAITRLLRGETLDALARELGVTAATIADWREAFLYAGEAALKTRGPTPQDAEIRQLKEALGDMAMRLELAREANRRLGLNVPFGSRRSRP